MRQRALFVSLARIVERILKMEENVQLASPWIRYVGRLEALFSEDPAIAIVYDDDAKEVKLLVEGQDKAEALTALLPGHKEFGNVTLDVKVVPANGEMTEEDMYQWAFAGNPIFRDVVCGEGPAGDVSYALFAPQVVQLREDDISEYDGYATLTFAELAKSVLETGDVKISSDLL